MGVHGLATYLREHRRSIAANVEHPLRSEGVNTIVVDGWSFIYELQQHPTLERQWVYGGEYAEFAKVVKAAVYMWLAVGLRVHFVFDGPYPELKFPTLVSRAKQACIDPAALFFHTSQSARVSSASLRQNRILPPLSYSACVHALRCLASDVPDDVFVHFADEEGDPWAVDLAGRLGAYVIGNDSDFVVLNAEGYQGYIPLEELSWTWTVAHHEGEQDQIVPLEEDGWVQSVRKGKKKTTPPTVHPDRRTGLGVIPAELDLDLNHLPESVPEGLTLIFPVYRPAAFAAQLGLSPSLLPLVGAIVGNDYTQSNASGTTRQSFSHLFFPRDLSVSQRIILVASTLHGLLSGSSASSKKRAKPVTGVMDLIDGAITKLLLRDPSTLGSGERARITEKIVDAALQYAIAPREEGSPVINVSPACTIHTPEVCPLVNMFAHAGDGVDVATREIRRRYIAAYRAGNLAPRTMDALCSGTAWPKVFLENPNLESTARSIGRPVREWVYAILDDSVGLPDSAQDDLTMDDEEDDNELIDVVEEQTDSEVEVSPGEDAPVHGDPLSELEMKLQRLQLERRALREGHVTSNSSTRPASSLAYVSVSASGLTSALSTRVGTAKHKVIKEHIRKATRLAEEAVAVPLLSSLFSQYPDSESSGLPKDISFLLQDDEARLNLFLRVLQSDVAELRALPREQIMVVAVIRYVVQRVHQRAQQSTGLKDRHIERWTCKEARAFLHAFDWHLLGTPTGNLVVGGDLSEQGSPVSSRMNEGVAQSSPALIVVQDRNVQLVAQASAAMEAAEQLMQVLFLCERVPSPVHLFSGRRFHSSLASNGTSQRETGQGLASNLDRAIEACTTGLDDAFADENLKKSKKDKKKAASESLPEQRPRVAAKKPQSRQGGSMFSFLASMDVE